MNRSARGAPYLRGVALVLLGGLSMSAGGLLLRLVESAPNWTVIAYRAGAMGAAFLIIVTVNHRARLIGAFRAIGWWGLAGGVIMALSSPAYVLAINNTTVANAMFLLATMPLMASALGWAILGERVRRAAWAACGVALVGVVVMVYDGLEAGGLLGNVMALGAAATFAAYAVIARRGRLVDMLPALAIAGFGGSLIGVGAADSLAISLHDLMLAMFMGAVQVMLGFLLITRGARHVPAGEVMLLALTEAVFSPVWVWLAVGEVPTLLTLGGGGIVLSAVVGLGVSGIRTERAERPPATAAAENRFAQLVAAHTASAGATVLPAAADLPRPRAPGAELPRPRLERAPVSAPPDLPANEPANGEFASLEAVVRAGLKPVLAAWLEANLRTIVSREVVHELRAISRGAARGPED
ncbi:MAG: DUF2497 domain-containing protein [Alphaproteobacteria bacterium]